MDIQTFTAAEGADPTRLRLERVPDPLNPHVSSGNTDKVLTTRVNFTRPEAWVALIRPAPGVLVPDNLEWVFYERDRQPGETHYAGQKPHLELVLEATNDPVMDYVAREDRDPAQPDKLTWFALSDWENGEDQEGDTEAILVTPMLVRSRVRDRDSNEQAMSAPDPNQTYLTQKILLGQTFGTKKARKAIEDREMNTLRPESAKEKSNGDPEKLNAADKATLDEISIITSTMATRQELQDAVDAARPVPKANLEATEIADVYDPNVFIGAAALKAVPILDWQEAMQQQENIKSVSQFVARRLERVGRQDQPADKLRLLRYLSFVIRFYTTAKPGPRNAKVVPQKDVLAQNLAPAPHPVIENIRRKFSSNGVIDETHTQLIMTHCCTLAAIIDNFETDVEDLREDLGLNAAAIKRYFFEIGARVVRQTGQNGSTGKRFVAKLALPLQFPKQSRAAAPKR